MNKEERSVAAGFLACMKKHAAPDLYEQAAGNPMISGLLGAGLGAGVGGLGSYLASRGMYQDETNPRRAAKKRNRNLLLGLLGGGALGGAAGIAPGLISGVRGEMAKGEGATTGLANTVKDWTLPLLGGAYGGVKGREIGLQLTDKQTREALRNAITRAGGNAAAERAQYEAVAGRQRPLVPPTDVLKNMSVEDVAKAMAKHTDEVNKWNDYITDRGAEAVAAGAGKPDEGIVAIGKRLGLPSREAQNLVNLEPEQATRVLNELADAGQVSPSNLAGRMPKGPGLLSRGLRGGAGGADRAVNRLAPVREALGEAGPGALKGEELRNAVPADMQEKLPSRWRWGGLGAAAGTAAGAGTGIAANKLLGLFADKVLGAD